MDPSTLGIIVTAIAATASTATAIASWRSVVNSKKINSEIIEEKHLSVQPFFHAMSTEHNKGSKMGELILRNDGNFNIRINNVTVKINGNETISAKFKYLKQDSPYVETGKSFSVTFSTEEISNSTVVIEMEYSNQYNKTLVARSPKLKIIEGTLVGEGFLYVPFFNLTK